MFGENIKRRPLAGDGSVLFVKNIFKTLQGEGPFYGTPAVFIRLGGCNLACKFCDTEFEDFTEVALNSITEQVNALSLNHSGKKSIFLVVITGGEPLRQPIAMLCQQLIDQGFKVQIETNGILFQELPQGVDIICSPKIVGKKYSKVHAKLLPNISALKFLISKSFAGYDIVPELGQRSFNNIEIFLQPMDQYDEKLNKENVKLAIDLALNTGYRVSYQMHKILGIE